MVYLYSTISGFRTIFGSIVVQAAMVFCLFLFVQVPQDSYLGSQPYEGANEHMERTLRALSIQMTFSHIANISATVISQMAVDLKLTQVLSVAGVVFYVITMV